MNKQELTDELRKIGSSYNRFKKIWHGQYFLRMVKKCKTLLDVIEIMECQNLRGHYAEELKSTREALFLSKLKVVKTGTRKVTDDKIVQVYTRKRDNAKDKGIEFTLSLSSIRNLLRAKRCHFSGLPLTETSFSIDRIDNSKGYIKGNVAACHCTFNMLKGQIENPLNDLTFDAVLKGMKKIKKYGL